eukprot:1929151-Pleurochrysis_carterae.AAC.1
MQASMYSDGGKCSTVSVRVYGEAVGRRGRTGNSLGDRGIAALAEALKVNTSLATLNVQCALGLTCVCGLAGKRSDDASDWLRS